MTSKRKRRVVVTAGPTREHVDPVRYLTNESSGKMGFAIAAAAAKAGHHVTLVAGPVHLETPKGVKRVDVVSARDMLKAVRESFADADALYMAAAVSDWRPKRKLAGKWRKKDGGAESTSLELARNPDILATVAKNKGERLVVGFALETGDGLRRAQAKMKRKGTDYVVLNDPSALAGANASVQVLGADGSLEQLGKRSKDRIAQHLIGLLPPG